MEREYIRVKKPDSLPLNTCQLRVLDDEFWKKWVFYFLLDFYKNYNSIELKAEIEEEREKQYPRIERQIAKFLRLKLKENREFGMHFSVKGEETNDEDVEGNYDITIHNTYWKSRDFYFECKNLDGSKDLTSKYVCCNTYRKNSDGEYIFDGGVLRYFNGKYAQNLNFGGMIGFLLSGNDIKIKNDLMKKLAENLHTTPEGDLIEIKDNSIEGNTFTFDSLHSRKNTEFTIHHLLFDLTQR